VTRRSTRVSANQERREAKALALYLDGLNQFEIAAKFGYDNPRSGQVIVSKLIKSARQKTVAKYLEEYHAHLSDQIEVQKGLLRKAIEGYERSCKPKKSTRDSKTKKGKKVVGTTYEVKEEKSVGDVTWLNQAERCSMNIAKLIGNLHGKQTGDNNTLVVGNNVQVNQNGGEKQVHSLEQLRGMTIQQRVGVCQQIMLGYAELEEGKEPIDVKATVSEPLDEEAKEEAEEEQGGDGI
jgi:hypothetical protein